MTPDPTEMIRRSTVALIEALGMIAENQELAALGHTDLEHRKPDFTALIAKHGLVQPPEDIISEIEGINEFTVVEILESARRAKRVMDIYDRDEVLCKLRNWGYIKILENGRSTLTPKGREELKRLKGGSL